MGRIKIVTVELPQPYGQLVFHLLQLSSNRASKADAQHGAELTTSPLASFDEIFEKVFNQPGTFQMCRETIRVYLVNMPAIEGYSEVCTDSNVRLLLSSAGCIARNARHFRLLSVQAIMHLIRRRGGNRDYTSPFLCLQMPGLFDGCPEGVLPGTMNVQDEAPLPRAAGLQFLQARRSSRNAMRVPRLRDADTAGPSTQAAADDMNSTEGSSDNDSHHDRDVVEADDSNDSNYTDSSAKTTSDDYDSDDYYVRGNNDEPRDLRRALRKQSAQFKRQSRHLTHPITPQASPHTHQERHGRFAVRDYELPVRLQNDIESFLLTALDTSLDNSTRDVVFKKTLSYSTVDRYGKDIKKFLGYLTHILGWPTRELGLEMYADTQVLSKYLEFLQSVRKVAVSELEKQVTLAAKINHYLSYLLTLHRDNDRVLGAYNQDNKHTKAMQRLEAMAIQLRHRARYQRGASVR